MQLTKCETEIMEVLWDSPLPMARAAILDTDHTWKEASIHILLNSLLKKGAIEVAGSTPVKKTYSRLFRPTISREQYWAQLPFCENGKVIPELLIAEILNQAGFTYDGDAAAALRTAMDLFAKDHNAEAPNADNR